MTRSKGAGLVVNGNPNIESKLVPYIAEPALYFCVRALRGTLLLPCFLLGRTQFMYTRQIGLPLLAQIFIVGTRRGEISPGSEVEE
jgi:hypothetical protein